MADRTLRHCRILVVEDEYMLADELQMELADADAIVLGPVSTVKEAIDLIASEAEIDGSILDVNLGGEFVFPVADRLAERGVPFLFTTGYDGSIIPARFADIDRCEKPINMRRITKAIGRVIHP
ncbi:MULTISPECIES: response regulator [unclassified Sphingomonas]|uniref:response regulator n=1 Tax=unclassified Sphingomonas TaxID=196159 RepID=UPI002859FC12|nr:MULTISPECIES: response regulator [unclassified Sphingomonas]MDR6113310.1 DNA-binding NtrC family response regulator [Sphingomonas sp. SORGH_AS_0789]MDR6149329.1 DNA-binding NtrC family response regulator [Sphingomonas sp. SORGH_AS_0742]